MEMLLPFPAPDGHWYLICKGNQGEWLASCSEAGRNICLISGSIVVTNGSGYWPEQIIGIIICVVPWYDSLDGELPIRPGIKIRRADNGEEIYADLHELDLAKR